MRKVSFLLVLSMLLLTGCFDKKTRVVDTNPSGYLDISDSITIDDTGEITNTGDGSTSGFTTIIEGPTSVPVDRPVTISFTDTIDEQTVDAFSIYIIDKDLQPVPTELTVVDNQVHITPNAFFLPNETYIIVITTAVKDIDGRSFEGVILYTFTTAPLPDTTAPTLTSLTPADSATDVVTTTNVSMTFDENITDNGVTLLVKDSAGTTVAGTNTVNANTLNFNPTSDLAYNEAYTVTLQGTVTDLSGNAYTGTTTWSFTTLPLPDTTAPALSSLTPADSAIDVVITTNVSMTFDENIADNGVTLLVKDSAGTTVAGTNTVNADTLNFDPTSDLAYDEAYTVTLQGTVTDLSGNGYTGITTWSFTTLPLPDTTAPALTSLTPSDGETDVDRALNMTMVFDENIADNGVTLLVKDSVGTTVAGTNTVNANTLNFNPTSDLAYNEAYTVTLQGTVRDLSDNAYTGITTWSFTTLPLPDTTAPALSSLTPANGATDVVITTNVSMTFDENITDNGVTLLVKDSAGTTVAGTNTVNSDTLNFDPTSDLAYNEAYTVTLQGTVTDLSDNAYTGITTWSFTTLPLPDTTAPTLTSLTPADGVTDVVITTNVSMTFDENIADNGVTLLVKDSAGTTVAGTNTVNADTLNFNPTSDLAYDEAYTVTLQGTVTDLSDNAYTGITAWSFTVGPDMEAPTLIGFIPVDGAINVDKSTEIKVIFDENVTNGGKVLEVTDETLGTTVSGTDGYTGNTLWFIPDSDLIVDHNYSVLIHGPATEDLSGNEYTGQTSWSFIVDDTTPPTITGISPADGTTVADKTPEITMTFDEEILNVGQTLKVRNVTTDTHVNGTSGDTGNQLWFIPNSPLVPGHDYNVTVQGDTEDLSWNVLATAGMSWEFSVAPFEVSTVFYIVDLVTVLFPYNVDPATVSENDFQINSGAITFHGFYYSDLLKTVTFIADVPLTGSEVISVSGTITDTEGNFVNDGISMDYSL